MHLSNDFYSTFLFGNVRKNTSNTDISAGETPEILEACPIELGLCLLSFCLASKLIPFTENKEERCS